MEPAKRIVVNTIAQYSKSVINTCLSLYTVRLVLSALGQSDYGIFNLIAGIVAMIGFITNALVITTQRHLSYYQGKEDGHKVEMMFANSILLHLFIGIVLCLVFLCMMDYLCMDYLNIEDSRRETSQFVYLMSVCILFLTCMSAPFKALFIAHENIIYISIVEVIDGMLKLTLALTLLDLDYDKLRVYACIMMFIVLFQFIAFAVYAIFRFKECRLSKTFANFDRDCIKELMGFATWTTYGMGAVIFRQQGLAVLINKFFGTIYNASYGIANQIYGALSFIVTSIVNAMNPQIMKAEGQHNRQQMYHLAEQESKFIVSVMALIFIPLIFEMDNVLHVWLGNVPVCAVFFSQCIFITFLIDQITYGLHSAAQAIGQIRTYTILMYTPKLLSLVIFWGILKFNGSIEQVMYCYIGIEALVAIMRLPYLHKKAGLDIKSFLYHVPLRLLPLITVLIALSYLQQFAWSSTYRFFFTIPLIAVIGSIIAWFSTFTPNERNTFIHFVKK